jgi:hypothetical protein
MPFVFGAFMQGVIGRVLASAKKNPAYSGLGASAHYGQAFKPVLAWAILTVFTAIWLKTISKKTVFK